MLVVASSSQPYILYVCHDKTSGMKIIGILPLEMSPWTTTRALRECEDDTKNDAGFCPGRGENSKLVEIPMINI